MLYRILFACLGSGLFASMGECQQIPSDPTQSSVTQAPQGESKRILGIIPNYRTSPSLQNYEPLTSRREIQDSLSKMRSIAAQSGWQLCSAAKGQLTNCKSILRARRCGIRQVFRSVIRRFRNRRLHDGGGLPHSSPPRSPVLSTRHRKRMVQARLRHGADLLDPSRFGWDAVGPAVPD